MPFGLERLNERSMRPNVLINFIKPIEGPDKAIAEDFLNRIAAQCYPVMKAASLSVMSLEEFPPNREFLGRNFNAGECIQLVLKDKQGRWLSFNFVQMVMMHELAHCKQMNHSKYFWKVRNQFTDEMKSLWQKKYQGEGVWGRGRDLQNGGFVLDREVDQNDIPEHLCGGSYRRRGQKRKRAGLSYAERQQRRVEKKFGKHGDGNALGEDELVRGALEQGHRHAGKPRVANSKRGRELRAQAALARFESAKRQQPEAAEIDDDESSGDESVTSEGGETVAFNGHDYVKICSEEDEEEIDVKQEMDELRGVSKAIPPKLKESINGQHTSAHARPTAATSPATRQEKQTRPITGTDTSQADVDASTAEDAPRNRSNDTTSRDETHGICKICSLQNDPQALLCMACANVLRPHMIKGVWRCKSEACQGNGYLNAGDVGRCGICGAAKPATVPPASHTTGLVSADVLRWD